MYQILKFKDLNTRLFQLECSANTGRASVSFLYKSPIINPIHHILIGYGYME